MARLTTSGLAGIAAALGLPLALAQDADPAQDPTQAPEQDLTLPPTIETVPGQSNLEPAPEERDDVIEAVVTSGQTEFRLPDLGTALREEREQVDPDQRMIMSPLRLYDPEADPSVDDNFLEPEVLRGVGFIRMIEFRFGRNREAD